MNETPICARGYSLRAHTPWERSKVCISQPNCCQTQVLTATVCICDLGSLLGFEKGMSHVGALAVLSVLVRSCYELLVQMPSVIVGAVSLSHCFTTADGTQKPG